MTYTSTATALRAANGLKPGEKLLLAVLSDRAREYDWLEEGLGAAFPSIMDLCHQVGQSRATIFRHLNHLKEIGAILVENRWKPDGETGQARQQASLYIINTPAILAGCFNGQVNLPEQFKLRIETCLYNTQGLIEGLRDSLIAVLGSQKDRDNRLKVRHPIKSKKDINNNPLPPTGVPPHPRATTWRKKHKTRRRRRIPTPQYLPTQPAREGEGFNQPTTNTDTDTSKNALTGPQEQRNPYQRVDSAKSAEKPREATTTPNMDDIADWALINQCLPEGMRDFPMKEARIIANQLRARINAGWTPQKIRRILYTKPLPPAIKYLPGLIKARLNTDVPINSAPQPQNHTQTAQTTQENYQQQRAHKEIERCRREYISESKASLEIRKEGFDAWLKRTRPETAKLQQETTT
jgi:hypothetical protein